jgi:hypothetical protein
MKLAIAFLVGVFVGFQLGDLYARSECTAYLSGVVDGFTFDD